MESLLTRLLVSSTPPTLCPGVVSLTPLTLGAETLREAVGGDGREHTYF